MQELTTEEILEGIREAQAKIESANADIALALKELERRVQDSGA